MQLSREQYTFMTDYIKRQYAYSAGWCKKVEAMPDEQIYAVFCSFRSREKMKPLRNKTPKTVEISTDHQISIWEYMKGVSNGEGNLYPAV